MLVLALIRALVRDKLLCCAEERKKLEVNTGGCWCSRGSVADNTRENINVDA